MPRKPVWIEGLFLTQHHLQQLDRYHERLLDERLKAAVPHDWGITDLEVDERALASGQLRITRLAAILPDGTPIRCLEGTDMAIAPRSFEQEFAPHLATLDVYVAIAASEETAANVDLEGRAVTASRWVRAQSRARDVNTGATEQAFDWARPNLRLLFGEERRDAFDVIRVAQLTRAASGQVVLRDAFVPPVLRIGASTLLSRRVRELLTAMTARHRDLVDSRRQRTSGAVEMDATEVSRFWFLGALSSFLPVFSHFADAPATRPLDLYLELSKLIGQLAILDPNADATVPKLLPLDLAATFEPMFGRALQLVGTTVAERCVAIPLDRQPTGVHQARLSPAHQAATLYLAISGTIPEEQVRDRLVRLMKIASANQIGAILNSALNGARAEIEYRPPVALPLRPGVTFLKIQRTPEFWTDIAASGTLAIYQPFDAQAVSLALYAVTG